MNIERLPAERNAITRKFKIPYTETGVDGQPVKKILKFYVKAGMYPDGRLGEIFITGDKIGDLVSGALDSFAMVFSVGLQHGVPVQMLTSKLRHHQFGPSGFLGPSGEKEFTSCSSMFDLIAQWIDVKFPDGKLASSSRIPP